MTLKDDEIVVTMRTKKYLIELIDNERKRFSQPRSSWIIQAAVEKLEKLGYEVTPEK
jgi:hypothetical protein